MEMAEEGTDLGYCISNVQNTSQAAAVQCVMLCILASVMVRINRVLCSCIT
jgi:hypothetical protein